LPQLVESCCCRQWSHDVIHANARHRRENNTAVVRASMIASTDAVEV
jgi:hypothetical protein